MKISRLGVTLGLAALVAGAVSLNAQDSPSVGVVADFLNQSIVDVFGGPTIVDTTDIDFTPADSSVFTDGGGKISGFATGTVTPTEGTAADVVLSVSGTITTKGTAPSLKLTLKGSGAPSDGTEGKSSFKLTFTSTGSPAPITTITTNNIIGTNVIDLNDTNTFIITTNEVPTGCVTNCVTNIVGGVTNIDCEGTNIVCTGTNFVTETNATTFTNTTFTTNTTDAAFTGKATFTYKSGVKGEKAITRKNVEADVTDIDSETLNVSIGVVGGSHKLYAAGRINPETFGLPVIGSGSSSSKNNKFSLKLKGTGVAKGSSLTLTGTSSSDAESGDVTLTGVKATGKVLGQKVNSTAADADVTVTSGGLPTGGGPPL